LNDFRLDAALICHIGEERTLLGFELTQQRTGGNSPASSTTQTQVRIVGNSGPFSGHGSEHRLGLRIVRVAVHRRLGQTLGIVQIAADGGVEARVDTPFLREDPARIAASPMLVDPGVSVITVQPGFTLWGIAEANFGDGIAYVQIFDENRDRIRDPDWIFPGQIFRLPDLPRTEDGE